MPKSAPRFSATKSDFVELDGGWDTRTPPFSKKPGLVRNAQNFECGVLKGVRRIDGYERFDGRAKPSNAAYATLQTTTITGTWAVGDTLTGATSGATGIVLTAGDDYFVLSGVIGDFVAGEDVQIGGVTRAITLDTQIQDGAATAKLQAQYKNLAADHYRTLIGAVPGSGDVLGVWLYNDVVYAFRNNADGSAAVMFKESPAGWVPVEMGRSRTFNSGGVTEILEGQTITGATSGASAVLTRVMLESGSWAAGTAAGRFLFASQTGTFVAENINVGAELNLATIAGDSGPITLLPDGRYEFENANFGGAANTKRMYGVDGVNKAFEFDGTLYCPISTGMAHDAPSHLSVFENHLFLSFRGSVQHSGTGLPYAWTIITGAGEIAQGDTVTGFQKQAGTGGTGGALAIFSRNKISILYGSSSADWRHVTYADHQGAYVGSIQQINVTLMLDDRGLTALSATEKYGNFQHATLSQGIQDYINAQRLKVNASCVVSDKNQYRLFFNDSTALYVTFGSGRLRGMMPIKLEHEVVCYVSQEMDDGTEVMFFGSSNGFVYQMDRGTSFDGEEIVAYADLAFNFSRTARIRKRYKHAEFEVQGEGYSEFAVSAEVSYGRVATLQPGSTTLITEFAPAFWDSFVWDNFIWDGLTLSGFGCALEGTGENISVMMRIVSDYYAPITFSGLLLDYSPRRRLRSG